MSVPPRDDTRQLGTSQPQAKLQGTRRMVCPQTCGMQAHRRVGHALVPMNRPPATIGHIMTGTGLQELLECIYASNTVNHMLGGKAISRAVRGHMLVSGALNAMLMLDVSRLPASHRAAHNEDDEQDDGTTAEYHYEIARSLVPESDKTSSGNPVVPPITEVITAAGILYDGLMDESITVESLQNSQTLHDIRKKLIGW